MKDAEGRTLEVGDLVVYIVPGYLELKRGNVVKVTPKGATIKPVGGANQWPLNRSSSQICFVEKPTPLPYVGKLDSIYAARYHVYYDDNSYDFGSLDVLPNFSDSIMKNIKKGAIQFHEYNLAAIIGIPSGVQFGVYQHPKTNHTIYLTLVSDG